MQFLKFIILILSVILLNSCDNPKSIFKTKKYDAADAKTKFPKYKDNGGEIKTNLINKGKVEKEAEYIKLKKIADDLINNAIVKTTPINTIEKNTVIEGLTNTVEVIMLELNSLYEELKNTDPNTKDGLKKTKELLQKIITHMDKKVNPISIVIAENSKMTELKSDVAFETGSSKLKEKGSEEITKQVAEIEKKIIEWRQYIDNNKIKIFENDLYKLKIIINGYADTQGSSNISERKKDNLELSRNRAESVKNEFKKQLDILVEKHKLITDIEYHGKGEELPPNVIDNGLKNNPYRRVCLIISVVSPSSLLIEN